MKTVLNFIAAVVFIEIGFFLLFGSGLNMNDMSKNLNNYQSSNIPAYGTEVELYIIDIGGVFLENENLAGIMYDTECYYLAQINDGRFVVLKTSKGSDTDEKILEYAEKCKDFYFFSKGVKPEILCIDGKIDKIPTLDEGDFKSALGSGVNKFMPERRYVRMDVSDIVVNVDHNVSGKSMDSILEQSIKIMASAANNLKKFLGAVVIFIGIALIISFIREILDGITYTGNSKEVLVAGDDVFKNISIMKSGLQDKNDTEDEDIIYDNTVKTTVVDSKEAGKKETDKKDADKKETNKKETDKNDINTKLQNNKKDEEKKSTAGKGFKLKSE